MELGRDITNMILSYLPYQEEEESKINKCFGPETLSYWRNASFIENGMVNGVLHSLDDLPHVQGDVRTWYCNGVPHRIKGPARIQGNEYYFYKHGLLHCREGPAYINTERPGVVEWWIDGTKVLDPNFTCDLIAGAGIILLFCGLVVIGGIWLQPSIEYNDTLTMSHLHYNNTRIIGNDEWGCKIILVDILTDHPVCCNSSWEKIFPNCGDQYQNTSMAWLGKDGCPTQKRNLLLPAGIMGLQFLGWILSIAIRINHCLKILRPQIN